MTLIARFCPESVAFTPELGDHPLRIATHTQRGQPGPDAGECDSDEDARRCRGGSTRRSPMTVEQILADYARDELIARLTGLWL